MLDKPARYIRYCYSVPKTEGLYCACISTFDTKSDIYILLCGVVNGCDNRSMSLVLDTDLTADNE